MESSVRLLLAFSDLKFLTSNTDSLKEAFLSEDLHIFVILEQFKAFLLTYL